MPFFDFHIHPVLKSQFSEKTASTEKFSPWEKFRKQDIPDLIRWCTEFPYILESQACLSQLVVNDCNLVCAVLYIAEPGMINNAMVKSAARGKLSRYLQQPRIDKIIQGNPYQFLVADDLPTLLDPIQFGVSDRKVKIIRHPNDYDEHDSQTIHVVFTLEGCHSLCDRPRQYKKEAIIRNLDDLCSRVPLISINPTHMEQSTVCNHAFAMPYFDDDIWKPTGRAISGDGMEIIKHCYENNILVDVKHMSLAARLQLYEWRNFGEAGPDPPPLVCTHAGFTGISKDRIADYVGDYSRRGGKPYTEIIHGKPLMYGGKYARPSFNPSSINLYDEDIRAILDSGGMIGLSLDKRILGFQPFVPDSPYEYPVEMEYVSQREESLFLPSGEGAEIGNAIADQKCITWEEIREGGLVNPNASSHHLTHFMAHILHVVVLSGSGSAKALKQVCIGSDFDGLINPIWCCENTDDIYHFKQDIIDHFENFAELSEVALPAGFDVREFAEDLFFRNGRDFVMKRLELLRN